jgi:hypothetical protein
MTDMTRMGGADGSVELHFMPKEIDLLRTGLQMLEDTFGHEEADELQEVQALLAKLERQRTAERAQP